jgi:predicted TIM-barrel fold metal-dependent hydrolase
MMPHRLISADDHVDLSHERALIAEEIMKGVPAGERELILSGNAARVWNL